MPHSSTCIEIRHAESVCQIGMFKQSSKNCVDVLTENTYTVQIVHEDVMPKASSCISIGCWAPCGADLSYSLWRIMTGIACLLEAEQAGFQANIYCIRVAKKKL